MELSRNWKYYDDVRKMSNLSSANETLKQKIIKKFSDFIY